MDSTKITKSGGERWRGKAYSFFSHTTCESFPCHKGVDAESFNCLFCYCPLYMLGDKCGGNFKYRENGVKDCSGCVIPHVRDNYGYIVEKFGEIVDSMKNTRREL